jgi:hypothetical protein
MSGTGPAHPFGAGAVVVAPDPRAIPQQKQAAAPVPASAAPAAAPAPATVSVASSASDREEPTLATASIEIEGIPTRRGAETPAGSGTGTGNGIVPIPPRQPVLRNSVPVEELYHAPVTPADATTALIPVESASHDSASPTAMIPVSPNAADAISIAVAAAEVKLLPTDAGSSSGSSGAAAGLVSRVHRPSISQNSRPSKNGNEKEMDEETYQIKLEANMRQALFLVFAAAPCLGLRPIAPTPHALSACDSQMDYAEAGIPLPPQNLYRPATDRQLLMSRPYSFALERERERAKGKAER